MKLKLHVTRFRSIFVITILLFHVDGFAQQSPSVQVIKGKVTDAQTNGALAGVSVGVKGTSTLSLTDRNGNYSISAGATATLIFSYVGKKSAEILAGNQTIINIKLHLSTDQLQEVVVTALGIKREKRSLGYSVTTVAGSSLTEARETNFVNGLEGKVAGVNVSNVATGPGGSANVVIRGVSDITGSNQ